MRLVYYLPNIVKKINIATPDYCTIWSYYDALWCDNTMGAIWWGTRPPTFSDGGDI